MSNSIIFIRTSTAEQTPALQLRDIGTLNPPSDAQIIPEQQSAFKDNVKRPELEKMLVQIKTGKVSDIYLWDLDRVYRNRLKLQEFFILCKIYKVNIHSFNQKWLEEINKVPQPFNDIMKDVLISFTGWTGEEESLKKSQRVKMSVRKSPGKKTLSHKGNVWGRKKLPKQTISRVLELHKLGMSVRAISKQVQVYDKNNNARPISKSAVHKTIAEFAQEKDS